MNPRLEFAEDGAEHQGGGLRKSDSIRETLRMFREGMSFEEIAAERKFVVGTIVNHLAIAVEDGEDIDLSRFVPPGAREKIDAAFEEYGDQNLTGVREHLGEHYSYDVLRVCRALRRRAAVGMAA